VDNDRDVIVALRQEGKTVDEIRDQAFPTRHHSYVHRQLAIMAKDPVRGSASRRLGLVTTEDMTSIQSMHDSGLSPGQIAPATGLSYATIRHRLRALGINPTPEDRTYTAWTDEEEAILRPLVHKRSTAGEKQALLPHRPLTAIRARLHSLRIATGLIKRRQSWSAEQDIELARLREEGMSQSKVALRLGRSYDHVVSRLKYLARRADVNG
jgi:IS30 family transposase